jgi:hypothetical protein
VVQKGLRKWWSYLTAFYDIPVRPRLLLELPDEAFEMIRIALFYRVVSLTQRAIPL